MAIAKNPRRTSRPRVKRKLDGRRADALGGSAGRILDVAERLVQMRGFNGMSYADIATALSVTNASVHYHFPTKGDLGERLIQRYEENFTRALGAIDARAEDPGKRLRAYARIYEDVLRDNRMCLCGMLAAELDTLPSEMKTRLGAFFDANEAWLVSVLEQGRSSGSLAFDGSASAKARMLVSSLEGAMLLARSYGQIARFTQVATQLLVGLSAPKDGSGSRRAS